MKPGLSALLFFFLVSNTSCVKSLLDKKEKEADASKYAGVWKATTAAKDVNNDGKIQENEKYAVTGRSELLLNSDGTAQYNVVTTTVSETYVGNWKLDASGKTITFSVSSDEQQFSIENNNELHTFPFKINTDNYTRWLIYNR